MATYQELLTAAQSDDLKKKVRVACMIAAADEELAITLLLLD